MEKRPGAEEIQRIVQASHIVAPAFTEKELGMLFEAQEHLARSGFVATAWSLLKLEREKGITLERALGYYQEVAAKVQELEKAVARLKQEHDAWQGRIEADVQAAGEARQERHDAEKELAAFSKQADREKKQLMAELVRARKEAEVSLEEVVETSKLKAEVKSRGFTVRLLLDLCQGLEVAPDAAERLARGIEENGALALANASRKQELEANQALIVRSQEKLALLEKQRHEEEEHLSKLREDKVREEAVHSFHRRFSGLGALMEYVVSWDRVAFIRCNHSACSGRFSVDRGPSTLHLRSQWMCPCCGGKDLAWDSQAYGHVGYIGGGGFIKLKLGE